MNSGRALSIKLGSMHFPASFLLFLFWPPFLFKRKLYIKGFVPEFDAKTKMKSIDRNRETVGETYYLTDGGLEILLIFHHGIKINHFAPFEL